MSEQASVTQNSNQFGISAIFWVTFTFGLGLSYLQSMRSHEIVIGGLTSLAVGMLVGAVIGKLSSRTGDGFFWGTLIAVFAYMSVIGISNYDAGLRLAWATVGAFTGAISGTLLDREGTAKIQRSDFKTALIAAVAAFVIMFTYASFGRMTFDLRLDQYAAPLIGIAVVFFVKLIIWVENQHIMPRYITATWLLVIILVGNTFTNS